MRGKIKRYLKNIKSEDKDIILVMLLNLYYKDDEENLEKEFDFVLKHVVEFDEQYSRLK